MVSPKFNHPFAVVRVSASTPVGLTEGALTLATFNMFEDALRFGGSKLDDEAARGQSHNLYLVIDLTTAIVMPLYPRPVPAAPTPTRKGAKR